MRTNGSLASLQKSLDAIINARSDWAGHKPIHETLTLLQRMIENTCERAIKLVGGDLEEGPTPILPEVADSMTNGRCQVEDRWGRVCVYGNEHRIPCRFKPYDMTFPQWDTLVDISKANGVKHYQAPGVSRVGSIKALDCRGFVKARPTLGRAWNVILTVAGREILENHPAEKS